jgi:2-aminobenzoate-CoA ligase
MPEPWVPTGRSAHIDDFAARNLPPRTAWPVLSFDAPPALRAYPAQLNCATELLDKQAAAHGDRPVLYYGNTVWSYGELRDKANRIARVLVEDFDVKPGDRVLLRAPNNPMYVAAWFAVMKVGAVAVATMPLLRRRELAFMSNRGEARAALCDARLAEELEAARPQCQALSSVAYFYSDSQDGLEARMAAKAPEFDNVATAADDVCLIAFTSGTTGDPKGCMHFHRDVMAIGDTFSQNVLRPAEDDIFAGSPPIAFTFGLGALVTFPMQAGAATVLVESYTPETTLQTIDRYGVSVLFTAPTAYRAMTPLVDGFGLASLKKCVSAGEALPLPTYHGWEQATGIRIIDGIGATEMLHIFISAAGDDIRPGATGKPVPGYEAKVVDDQGRDLPAGQVGRLAVRGPTGCRYLDNPEKQAAYVADGWNFTGDAYRVDEDGYFHYQARTDDMIVSAGYNISGPEVEAVLLEHPAVLECAVIGAPDAERGQVVKAFIVTRDGTEPSDDLVRALQDFVKAEIAPYKYPRRVAFAESLPRTQTGKLQRYVLRESE